jgi:argininosuccinate synthase
MTNRVVLAYFGDVQSSQAIAHVAGSGGEAVAVVLDLGGPAPLKSLRESALAAGALRCHALDVRDEFIRDVLLPSLDKSGGDPVGTIGTAARAFVAQKVEEIADVEQAQPEGGPGPVLPWMSPPMRFMPVGAASLAIRFAAGLPVALNEVPMSLSELLESVETITGVAAFEVLQIAVTGLDGSREGVVALRVQDGRCEAVPALTVQ